jgi:hypothetical protein
MNIETLNLQTVIELLESKRVLVGLEDDRNPVVIAATLGLIELVEIERVETGYFNKVDQSRMITSGRIVEPIAYGQRVLQATTRREL